MGHTAVQTSVAQGFLAAQATLFPRAETDRDLAKRQLVQRLSDEFLYVRSRLDEHPGARGTERFHYVIAPPLVIEMSCFFKDQLDSVRCSPSLPRDMDALSRVNTRGVELQGLVETCRWQSHAVEESNLSKKGDDPRTDQVERGLTQISRADNPKRKRPNCHSKTPRSRGGGHPSCVQAR